MAARNHLTMYSRLLNNLFGYRLMTTKYQLAFAVTLLMISPLVTSADKSANTGLFVVQLEPINKCYRIKERSERVQCFGEAVDSSWQKSQDIKAKQTKLIKEGKAIFKNPVTFKVSSDDDVTAVAAYIRKSLCGGSDCNIEQFAGFSNEIEAFQTLAATNNSKLIDDIIAIATQRGVSEPKYSYLLEIHKAPSPISNVPEEVVKQMKQKIEKENPDDYYIQGLLLKQAKKAYLELANMKEYEGIPSGVFNKIKAKIAEENVNDYYIQSLLVKQQAKAYLELNN